MAVRRRATRTVAAPPAALPGDVRLMNLVSALVFVAVALALLAAGASRLAHAAMFDIALIRVEGELTRNSVPTIRANALPALAGNFFSIDLRRAQEAFQQVPWVRRAVVRRVWPNQLVVQLEEHHAAALWDSETGAERLVNSQGEVFEANVGDVEDDGLPVFAGPEGSSAAMLALWRRLQPAFARGGLTLEKLVLTGRGSWRVQTDDAAIVELGRGSDDELVARSERFLRTLPQAAGRWQASLDYADLRHADGYALRLRGVSTTAAVRAGSANGVN
jgi:cell division protein FtsQ